MTGEKLTDNLSQYLTQYNTGVNIYKFDLLQERELPCVIVGYNSEEVSGDGTMFGYWMVEGFVTIAYQGYDDRLATVSNALADTIKSQLLNGPGMLSAMNLTGPLSADNRDGQNFKLNGFTITNIMKEDQESSVFTTINFEAFTRDFN